MREELLLAKEVLKFLEKEKIHTQTVSHDPSFTCEESKEHYDEMGFDSTYYGLPKNMFLRDKKGHHFFLVILDYQKKIDFAALSEMINDGKKVGLATPDDLVEQLGVRPGSVSLFSLINASNEDISVYIDEDLMNKEKLAFHPNYNGLTTFIAPRDVYKFLDICNRPYDVLELAKISSDKEIVKSKKAMSA